MGNHHKELKEYDRETDDVLDIPTLSLLVHQKDEGTIASIENSKKNVVVKSLEPIVATDFIVGVSLPAITVADKETTVLEEEDENQKKGYNNNDKSIIEGEEEEKEYPPSPSLLTNDHVNTNHKIKQILKEKRYRKGEKEKIT